MPLPAPRRRSPLVLGTFIAGGLLLAAAAPTASARILPGRSVAGIQLGASQTAVRRALGTPETQAHGSEWRYTGRVGLHVRFKRGRVVQLLSFFQAQATPSGITIGTRRVQLARIYPHAKCHEGRNPTYLYCVVPGRLRGRATYTGFLFEAADAGIVEIELGYGSVAQALKHP